LWSKVSEHVSNVSISGDRISTRRTANERREQFVDMLQRNVENALAGRLPQALSSDGQSIPRSGPLYLALSRTPHFTSFEEYLSSFVVLDDEEITPEEAQTRAETQAVLMNKIEDLKSKGRLDIKPIKPFVDPEVPKLHHNWLLEHVMTSSRLIKEEGKLQMARARKVSKMITKHFELLHGKSEREQKLEEKRIKKLAKLTSNEVRKKWRFVEGVIFLLF
jgi:hypothetical protein